MTLLVNGIVSPLGDQARTFGDLVAVMDRHLASGGDVMTAVRLDGVDEPAFRDPTLCAQPVVVFEQIEVETGEPKALARRCLSDAAMALSSLSTATRSAADGFRGHDVGDARRELEQVSQGLLSVLRIVAAAGLALRHELDTPDAEGRSVNSLSADLDRIVQDLVAGQQSGDWVGVADILEYDLDPMLHGWRTILTRLAAA